MNPPINPTEPVTPAGNAVPVRNKILVDTDIGSDLDDALAISYLLAQPDVDLLGVTTATGQPDIRAQLVSVLCETAGRAVPIHIGHSRALDGSCRQPDVAQADVLDRWPARPADGDDAVAFLADAIDRNPGDVTLVCMAPLTNIAHLADRHPDAIAKLRRIVVMGGHFTRRPGRPNAEWNFALDPAAAQRIYGSRVTDTVGLDVTHDVRFRQRDVEHIAELAPRFAPLRDFAIPHFAKYDDVYLHDVLAAAVALGHDHCTFVESGIVIDDDGASSLTPQRSIVHSVATSVDAARFEAHVLDVLVLS